jgi:hypothetical protein
LNSGLFHSKIIGVTRFFVGGAMPDRRLIDDPEFWRSRAEEVRAIANDMKEAEAKAIMDRIANDYERLAKHAEKRRNSRPPG